MATLDRIIYIPTYPEPKKKSSGNGGREGHPVGRPMIKSLKECKSVMGRNGCRRWYDCFTCPFEDCNWEYERERSMAQTGSKEKPIDKETGCNAQS